MTDHNEQSFLSKAFETITGHKGKAIIAALLVTNTLSNSYDIVPSQNYAVRFRLGQMVSDQLAPGVYPKLPMFDDIYHFSNNTIIMGQMAGSQANTQDQNNLTAGIRLHYRTNPKAGYMALHAENMASDNGMSLVGHYLNQAVDSVVGSRPAVDTLNDPESFMHAALNNLEQRLKQNNVPVEPLVIELLTMNAGSLRKVIQYRLVVGGNVEPMAGPAAVSVPQGGTTATPVPPSPQG